MVDPLRDHPALFAAIRDIFHPGVGIYRHLHFRGPIVVNVGNDAHFAINHHGYHVENELFWAGFGNGSYEAAEFRVWRALVKSADFIADVGANTGVYSLSAAALRPQARVVALEPMPRIYEKLCANLALNPFNIQPLQIAVSDSEGDVAMFYSDFEHEYSASLDATMLVNVNSRTIKVRATRLDGLLDELGWPRIDLIKIDVEKHEPAVLSGFVRRLCQDRPTMLIEILNSEIWEAVVGKLDGLKYRYFSIGGEKGLSEVREFEQSGGRNYLFLPSEAWTSTEPRIKAEFS
ncbi:MAG TPA: FkbM family methyltransferase [Methylocystis sp.]|nr:FkbM family methyltransferase [Methylocystis sp.]